MLARRSESSVTCDERDIKSFAQRHEGCIVGGDVVAQPPDAVRQRVMGVAHDGEITEVHADIGSALLRQPASCDKPPQSMQDLDIDEMRSVKIGVSAEALNQVLAGRPAR